MDPRELNQKTSPEVLFGAENSTINYDSVKKLIGNTWFGRELLRGFKRNEPISVKRLYGEAIRVSLSRAAQDGGDYQADPLSEDWETAYRNKTDEEGRINLKRCDYLLPDEIMVTGVRTVERYGQMFTMDQFGIYSLENGSLKLKGSLTFTLPADSSGKGEIQLSEFVGEIFLQDRWVFAPSGEIKSGRR